MTGTTARLLCSRCGKSVSTEFVPIPTDTPDKGLIVRAWIECPECIERELPELPAGKTAEALAQRFHEAYERLAPQFGYQTREASAKPWADVPEQNKRLMIAVCAELLAAPGRMSEQETARERIAAVVAEMTEWLGNEEGLMNEDIIDWRDRLEAALRADSGEGGTRDA